ISFDSLPGKTVIGSVAEVNKSADPQSRRFTVRVRLDNAGEELRSGMFSHVTFTLSSIDAPVTVPREAIQQKSDGAHVFVVDSSGTAHDTKVEVGVSDPQ